MSDLDSFSLICFDGTKPKDLGISDKDRECLCKSIGLEITTNPKTTK